MAFYSGDFEAVSNGNPSAGWGWADEQWTATGGPALTRSDLPLTTELGSVLLQAPAGAQVLGQRFVGGQDPQALRALAVGQRVNVWTPERAEPLSGTLVNAGPGPWVLEDAGKTTVVEQVVAWQADMGAGASSRWEWETSGTASAPWRLTYSFSGVAWRADTVINLDAGEGCSASWSTDALVANRTGQALSGTGLALFAGSPNRSTQPSYATSRMEMAQAAPMAAPMPPMPQAESAGEQYRYALEGAFRLPNGSVTRVPLARPQNALACERYYAIGQDPSRRPSPPRPLINDPAGDRQDLPVTWGLEITNTTEAGLGMPLPAGRVRVMDGGTWAGEADLGHTAVGDDVRLQLGTPFDITAERQRQPFALDADRLGGRETVQVTLRNAKTTPVTVRLLESFPRWRGWTLEASSVEPTERYGQGVRFDVAIPAGGETVLTYTVAYRWPDAPQ